MFKSPVLRSDWLERVTGWAGTLMYRHSTSGRKVSRAGRGAIQYIERLNQSERTRSQRPLPDWLERLSKWRAGGGEAWSERPPECCDFQSGVSLVTAARGAFSLPGALGLLTA